MNEFNTESSLKLGPTNYREFETRPHQMLPELRVPRSWQKFNTEVGLHPTEKPVLLCEYLIKTYTNEGEIVLDSVAVQDQPLKACQNTKRNFIGIDTSHDYCEIPPGRD